MNFNRIEISELPKKIPNYKKSTESKDILVYRWIKAWIMDRLKKNRPNELLPTKADMAYHLGVSIGTVQNAIRYIEDEGFIESKQRIGTLIKDINSTKSQFRKLTSKRETMIFKLKKMIIEKNYKIGDILPSSKEMCTMFASSTNTTRLALENLTANGIISTNCVRGTEASWKLISIPVISENTKLTDEIKNETLVSKIKDDLKKHISANYQVGQKMCAHAELASILDVSIKTVHDAMKELISEGYLLARRGRYGTVVVKLPYNKTFTDKNATQTYIQTKDAAFYNYQKIEHYLKSFIREKYIVGDKLPSMGTIARNLNVSTNTVKKALQNLHEEGYVRFTRGRYGGTFVTEIPDENFENTFKWLAVNPHYVKVYKN